MVMAWQGTRQKRADPSLTTYAWKQERAQWVKRLPLPCARGDHIVTSGKKYYPGTKTINPRSLVLGHKLARSTARALGYTEEQIHSPANLQVECWECSSKSGAKMGAVLGRRMQQQTALAGSKATRQPKPPTKINTEIRQAAARDRW
jgi:hypothetical protein